MTLRTNLLWFVPALATILFAGCIAPTAEDEPIVVLTTTEGGAAPATLPEPSDFSVAMVQALCTRLEECGPRFGLEFEISDRGYVPLFTLLLQFGSEGACLDAADELARTPFFPASSNLAAVAQGRKKLLEQPARACIQAIEEGACFMTQPEMVRCDDAFVGGVQALGGCLNSSECSSDLECLRGASCDQCRPIADLQRQCGADYCTASQYCDFNSDCVQRGGVGDDCDPTTWGVNGGCASDLACREDLDDFTATCQAPPPQGTVCYTESSCGVNAYCDIDRKCAPRRSEGRECYEDQECVDGLKCVSGRCSSEPPIGHECWDDTDCGSGLTCDEGYCHVAPEQLDDDETPAVSGEPCETLRDCDATKGLVCTYNPGAVKGLCEAMGSRRSGESCSISDACESGHLCRSGQCVETPLRQEGDGCDGGLCALGTFCDGIECAPLGDLGAVCQWAGECQAAFYCDYETRSCQRRKEAGEECYAAEECDLLSCQQGVCGLQELEEPQCT